MCKMNTINIKGKSYVQVNERIKAFRSQPEFKGYSLKTIVHELTADVCVMCAEIADTDGRVIATGWAREVRNDSKSMVNSTSYVENCETSAWGRALGNLGIGVDESICSAEELTFALNAQSSQGGRSTQATQRRPAAAKETTSKPAPVKDTVPTPQPVQTELEMPIMEKPLTADEIDELEGLYADMDSAENVDMLYFIYNKNKNKPYAPLLKSKGAEIKKERGWT